MSNGSDAGSAPGVAHEHLSALVDGELDGVAVSGACMAWRDDASSRATWHAYQLIGDVLRSDDLASTAAHDAGFLAALRLRLADEPVVLAPTPAPAVSVETLIPDSMPARRVGASGNSRWSWKAPSAVAAGFVVVAGALMVTRTPSADTSSVAAVAPSSRVAMLPDTAASAFQVTDTFVPPTVVATPNRQLIRDARLDRYLSAHKEFAGSTALGVPSGFLRDAVAESPSR